MTPGLTPPGPGAGGPDPHRWQRSLLAGVAVLLIVAAVLIAMRPPPRADSPPDGVVILADYRAGWQFADQHARTPQRAGTPPGPEGTRAACQLWINQNPTRDRSSWLAGCSDQITTRPPEVPR